MLVDLEIDKITTCTTLLIAMLSPSERIFCFYEIPKYQTWCLIPGGLGTLIEMFILL
jgi:predicted Rossmann-fold nucleotide-binding protein